MSLKAYLNGELIDVMQPMLTVANPAFLHGVGLFETLRAYEGKPFRLPHHIERLRASAEHFKMLLGESIEQIPGAVERVLEANGLADARLRITISPSHDPDHPENTLLLVTAQETSGYPKELYEKGMTVQVCTRYRQSTQDPLAGHKTCCYFPRLVALRDAQEQHCGEALWFTPENNLAEGCISSVFVVKQEALLTPPLDTPVLPGVTRATVLDLARAHGVPCEERALTIDDLLDADEVFLTNSVMEIMPVTRVERRVIGSEKPGPLSRKLSDLYQQLLQDPGDTTEI